MDTKTFAKMIARQVGSMERLAQELGTDGAKATVLLVTGALLSAQPDRLLEGLARAGAIDENGCLHRSMADELEEVVFMLRAGFNLLDINRDPGNFAKLMVWYRDHGEASWREAALAFAEALE